jgi:hypothetical protein
LNSNYAFALLYLLIVSTSLFGSLLLAHSTTYDVIIFIDNRLRDNIQNCITQFKQDLANENLVAYQYNITIEGLNASSLRNLLIGLWKKNSIKGCIMIGDLPYILWENHPDALPDMQFPVDYFFMDLDGQWIDEDMNGAYDKHEGDIAPEIWVGRICASIVEGNEVELIRDYFQKNHNYRTNVNISPWSRKALAYLDNGIFSIAPIYGNSTIYLEYIENTSLCLEPYGQDLEMIFDTPENSNVANAHDYIERLNSTGGYELVWLYGHGFQWSAPYYGHHTFTPSSEIHWGFYLKSSPKAVFYIWDICEAAEFNSQNCLGNSAIFGNGWGLVSMGMTHTGYPQSQFFQFFNKLHQQEIVGEAFMTVWNSIIGLDGAIDYDESKKWVILGDPTLRLSIHS